MNPTEQACDSQRIDDFLSDRLSGPLLSEFESHLADCEACRNALRRQAAEPEIWDEAFELLGRGSGAGSEHGATPNNGGPTQALAVLESLAPTDDPQMLGRLGEYEVSGVVGAGGMGAVLKGFDRSLRRVVAIKVMAPHLADSGSARTRFQREARAAAAITHDNVIEIYGVSEARGLPYLVMPFARGPSLQRRIDESGPATATEVVRIGRQIAAGLAAAHGQGLVHRDIKPANILLNDGVERLWITDFGVARAIDDASMTQTGLIAGTPQYMSPEQARGENVDARSDLFSLGSVLYTACTGRAPFRSESAYGILRRITDTDPRPIREINPDIPGWLCVIIDRLMAKHPSDRFPSAAEVARLLDGCLAHLQQPTEVELPPCLVEPLPSRGTGVRMHPEDQADGPADRRFVSWRRSGVRVMAASLLLTAIGFLGIQMTSPADISGHWSGEDWTNVSLNSTAEATDWYTGTFSDGEGRQGALQLEWSRLQRRYNGRWKLGSDYAGSLTLRSDGSGRVRGAVAVDSNSPASSGMPRLREFVWDRIALPVSGTGTPTYSRGSTNPEALDERRVAGTITIEAPIKGRIQRFGEGIHENARVQKGQLIAVLASLDFAGEQHRKAQLALSKQRIKAAESQLESRERSLQAAQKIVATLESQVAAYEQVAQQIDETTRDTVDSAYNKLDAEEEHVTALQAVLGSARQDFERQKKLHDEQIISDVKFQQAERKVQEAEAKVRKSNSVLEAARADLARARGEAVAKAQKARVDIDTASIALQKALIDAAAAEGDVAGAKLELDQAVQQAGELESRIAELRYQEIVAPLDGFVIRFAANRGGHVLKEGDAICEIVPSGQPVAASDGVPPEPRKPDALSDPSATLPPQSSLGIQAVPSLPADTGSVSSDPGAALKETLVGGITAPFGPVSDLSRRLHESRAAVELQKAELAAEKVSLMTAQRQLEELRGVLAQGQRGESPHSAEVDSYTAGIQSKELEINAIKSVIESRQLSLQVPTSALAEAELERDTIIRLLASQLELAKQRRATQEDLIDVMKQRFMLGEASVEDLRPIEQALLSIEAEVQRLELLLGYYNKIGRPKPATSASDKDDPPADPATAPAEGATDDAF